MKEHIVAAYECTIAVINFLILAAVHIFFIFCNIWLVVHFFDDPSIARFFGVMIVGGLMNHVVYLPLTGMND